MIFSFYIISEIAGRKKGMGGGGGGGDLETYCIMYALKTQL